MILVGEQHELAVAPTSVPPRVMEQHHREQAVRLRLVGHELYERTAEPQRLGREVTATAVPLVEDQVDDREDRVEALGQKIVGRNAKRDGRGFDLPLRPNESLSHRRFRHEERASDLDGGQPTEGPQRERDLRVDGECGMTTGEDELQALVSEGGCVHRILHLLLQAQECRLGHERLLPTHPVDRPVAGSRHQPGARIRRIPIHRPAFRRDREGLLRGFLREVEVAEEADERGQHAAPLVTEGLLEDRYHSMIGRTSIAPPRRAAGICAASAIAASRSSAS